VVPIEGLRKGQAAVRGLRFAEQADQWIRDHLYGGDAGRQHEQRPQKQGKKPGTGGGYEQQTSEHHQQ
jgi:hypothetical protein